MPDEETGSQERGAKHDIYRTRELNWKHDGFPNSDKSWLALAKETFSIAEKIRKDLIRLETGQSQQEKHDVKDLNQKYAKHAKYASTLHSQHKYAELEHSNQSLLALSLGFYGRHPKPPFNLELGCLSMIAAAYEEQGKYPQASGIYEHIYQRQNEGKGIPESMHAELERRNRPSLKYWTRRANLLITSRSSGPFAT